MKIMPIMLVTGIRIELTIDEALRMVQEPQRAERIQEEIRTMLNGSGVDPDTGLGKTSVLGLKPGLTPESLPALEKKDTQEEFKCSICGKSAKTRRGLGVHVSRMHKEFND